MLFEQTVDSYGVPAVAIEQCQSTIHDEFKEMRQNSKCAISTHFPRISLVLPDGLLNLLHGVTYELDAH